MVPWAFKASVTAAKQAENGGTELVARHLNTHMVVVSGNLLHLGQASPNGAKALGSYMATVMRYVHMRLDVVRSSFCQSFRSVDLYSEGL